jgi:arabinogalactan oligomer/maltooligosaccharide transport system substrate-binding protein
LRPQVVRCLALFVISLTIATAACGSGDPTAVQTGSRAPASEQHSSTPAPTTASIPQGSFNLKLWVSGDRSGDTLAYVKDLTDAYTALHDNVQFDVQSTDADALRDAFEPGADGARPDLVWMVDDFIAPFVAADQIIPLDSLVDRARFVPAAREALSVDGVLWGAPVSIGNQLMLYWNKELAGAAAPANSAAWIAKAKELTTGGRFGISYNETDSFWLVPFLEGYGGSVFADDGKTPTLDTEAMRSALKFLYDLRFTAKVTPANADYDLADRLFREGNSAYVINGDWTLDAYAAPPASDSPGLGDNLGVSPLPALIGGGNPKPYIVASFVMIPKAVGTEPNVKAVVADFLDFATNRDNQLKVLEDVGRIPANAEAIKDPAIAGDPVRAGVAAAAQLGVPQPANAEMRCVYDAMNEGMRTMFGGSDDFAALSEAMQSAALHCISSI